MDEGEDSESFKPRDSAGEADEPLVVMEAFEGWISQWGDSQHPLTLGKAAGTKLHLRFF